MAPQTQSPGGNPLGQELPYDVLGAAAARLNDIVIITEAEPFEEPGPRILYANPAFERITGYRLDEIAGRSPRFLSGPETSKEELARIEAELRSKHSAHAELLNYRKDGSTFWVEIEAVEVTSPSSGEAYLVFIERDITERKLLQAQVIQGQRLESIGTLAGGIAHDLNNVFAPIMMASGLLADRAPDREATMMVNAISTSAKRGAELVRQILLFARGMEGPRVPVEPAVLLAELHSFLESTFPKSVRIEVEGAEGVPALSGDPAQLHQALLNLSVNSRDAMPAGGTFRIRASTAMVHPSAPRPHPDAVPGEFVRIDISDTGSGIPHGVRSRIFDPFFTTKGTGGGNGLGLSTARAIIKAHGGFITYVTAEGAGTTFSLFLPTAEAGIARPVRATDAAPKGPVPRGNGERILIVDDEETVRLILRTTLETFGFSAFPARDGEEAVALVERSPSLFGLAIVDMQMPGMDGAKTIGAIRKIRPDLPVIGASGYATQEKRREATSSGPVLFLDKPFNVETLIRTVHAALAGARG